MTDYPRFQEFIADKDSVWKTEILQWLKDAKSYVEQGWTRGSYAKNALGESVTEYDPSAVSWDASGACWLAARIARRRSSSRTVNDAYVFYVKSLVDVLGTLVPKASGRFPVTDWNDAPERTQTEVVDLFTLAIEQMEALSLPDQAIAGVGRDG